MFRYTYALLVDYCRSQYRKHPVIFGQLWPYILIFILTLIIEMPQIISGHIIIGSDTIFHFNRFYEDAMQISHRNLSYWISIYGYHHSARIVNAVYSPYLSYLMGLILLGCKSFFNFQILTDFATPLLAAGSLEIGFRIARLYSKYNKILLVVYAFTYQVFHWNISDNFTSIGTIVIPLIIGCLVKMISSKPDEARIIPIQLGGITALIVQVHLITALQSLILEAIIIPIAFFTVKNTSYQSITGQTIKFNNKWQFIKDLTSSVIIGATLCTNIFGGLWELFSENHVSPLAKLTFGQDRQFIYDSTSNDQFMNTSILVVMLVLIITTIAVANWQTRLIGCLSILFFILSTSIGGYLIQSCQIFSIFQYPSRFLVPAISLACFFMAMTFDSNMLMSWYLKVILLILSGFIVTATVSNYHATKQYTQQVVFSPYNVKFNNPDKYSFQHNIDKAKHYFNSHKLSKAMNFAYQGTGDYLPLRHAYNHNPYSIVYWDNINRIYNYEGNGIKIKKMDSKKGILLKINSDSSKTTMIPEVAYYDTQVTLNGEGIPTNTDKGDPDPINYVKVPLTVGNNYVRITYQPNIACTILVIINAVSWLIYIMMFAIAYLRWVFYIYRQNHEI